MNKSILSNEARLTLLIIEGEGLAPLHIVGLHMKAATSDVAKQRATAVAKLLLSKGARPPTRADVVRALNDGRCILVKAQLFLSPDLAVSRSDDGMTLLHIWATTTSVGSSGECFSAITSAENGATLINAENAVGSTAFDLTSSSEKQALLLRYGAKTRDERLDERLDEALYETGRELGRRMAKGVEDFLFRKTTLKDDASSNRSPDTSTSSAAWFRGAGTYKFSWYCTGGLSCANAPETSISFYAPSWDDAYKTGMENAERYCKQFTTTGDSHAMWCSTAMSPAGESCTRIK